MVQGLDHVSVIDGGQGDTLPRFLSSRGINRVDTVIVSHADADHVGGISLLLSNPEFQVGHVFVNPDVRETAVWLDFVSVMNWAKQRGTRFSLELTSDNPGQLPLDDIRLEVLAPSQEIALTTAGGHTIDGKQVTPNTMSAVLRVWAGDAPRLLIAGDIDQIGLSNLLQNNSDVRADVLVFPHHGGLPRTPNPDSFAELLTRAVAAHLVIFSIGRGRYGTPRPEVVSAVLRSSKAAHIACTQLSEHCATDLPVTASSLHTAFSRGAATRACCAGTIEVSLDRGNGYTPARSAHVDFIRQNAPTALCQQ